MGSLNITLISGLVLVLLWLSILTYLYFLFIKQRKGHGSITNETDLVINQKKIFEELEKLRNASYSYIQKTSINRFNPFGDTGGDLSFAMAILNRKGDGVVLSSLHGRSGTRIYAKPVKAGKPDAYELSAEEQQTVDRAMKG